MNLIFKLLGFLVLGVSLFLGWFWQSYNNFVTTPTAFSQSSVDFTIPAGSSLSGVANSLVTQGIVSDASLFSWMMKLNDQGTRIKAGEYTLQPGMTPRDIAAIFVAGKVKQYRFTIVEGWNFKQLMVALGANNKLLHELKGKTPKEIMASIGQADKHPEGQFLPDTYYFSAGGTDVLFLRRAYDAMQKTLQKHWQNRQPNLPINTAYEALTLASIVEKETGMAQERGQIAGVFIRRLKKNMRLQTDPTVIYGMGDSYTGNLKKRDLKKDTPYNTYRRKGLPPTPIAMPGEDAIKSALNPQAGETLYFVAKGDGSHSFSVTLAAHNKAVRKYQINQRKADYRSSPPKND